MARETQVVSQINTLLQAGQFASKKFQKGRFSGIAELIDKEDGQTVPCLKDTSGEITTHLNIDDIYPFELYHRTISTSMEDEDGFGNYIERHEVTEMRLVVIFQRNRIFATKELIKSGLALGMPREMTRSFNIANDLSSCSISSLAFNLNSKEVYAEEYGQTEQLLKPTTVMIAMSYQIGTVTDINCLEICPS